MKLYLLCHDKYIIAIRGVDISKAPAVDYALRIIEFFRKLDKKYEYRIYAIRLKSTKMQHQEYWRHYLNIIGFI